jgi:hypothetical protein
MAIPFHWYFELHYLDQDNNELIQYGESTCEKANTVYNRVKKWCVENNYELTHFDTTTASQHYHDHTHLYTLKF